MLSNMEKVKNIINIFGFGAFGSAIANALNRNPDNIVYISDPNIKNNNDIYSVLNSSVKINLDYSRIKIFDGNFIKNSFIFLALPSKDVKFWVYDNLNKIPKTVTIVNLSKGFNSDGEIIFSFLEKNFKFNDVLSIKGPSFAEEIKRGYPTLLTVTYNSRIEYQIIEHVKSIFNDTNILLEFNTDYIGVEVLSVLKNIYSIFLGIVDAKFDAVNTTFFVFTKSLKEIETLLVMYKGNKVSLLSAAGIGDFALTSLNDMSRNRTFGLFVGKGFYDKRNKHSVLVEGLRSIELVYNKAVAKNKIDELPILNFLYGIFFENKDINELNNLLFSL